jgi:hypothetical protein
VVSTAHFASGKPLWVDSAPGDPLLNARVDVGMMHAVGDAIEFDIRWPITTGFIIDLRVTEPGLVIPDGSVHSSRERVICRPEGIVTFAIREELRGPDGAELRRREYDAAEMRKRADVRPYGRDPRSLACYAAARKCARQAWSWPPPPNLAPLDGSERAARMRAEYAGLFVPACALSPGLPAPIGGDADPARFTRTFALEKPANRSRRIELIEAKAVMVDHGRALAETTIRGRCLSRTECGDGLSRAEVLYENGRRRPWSISGKSFSLEMKHERNETGSPTDPQAAFEVRLTGATPLRSPAKKLRLFFSESEGLDDTQIDIVLQFGKASAGEPPAASPTPPELPGACAELQRCCNVWRKKSKKDAAACDDVLRLGTDIGPPEMCADGLRRYATDGKGGCGS